MEKKKLFLQTGPETYLPLPFWMCAVKGAIEIASDKNGLLIFDHTDNVIAHSKASGEIPAAIDLKISFLFLKNGKKIILVIKNSQTFDF